MNPLTLTLVQMDPGPQPEPNLRRVEELLGQVRGADLVALPEVFVARGNTADYRGAAEPVPGPTSERLGRLAARHRVWLLAGSVLEAEHDLVYNTALLFDRQGRLAARYRKIHLFEATLDTGQVVREQDAYEPGAEPVMADIEGWKTGISICYDLRFPELYRHYAEQGAHLLLVPANFTQRTGKDHWEVLLRARAIENQCFVAAPDLCGTNIRTGVVSHGHSLVVDPWGRVLADADDKQGLVSAELDPGRLEDVRRRVPVLEHRRPEVFPRTAPARQ
jgi:predicted amidohydrolase